MPDDIHYYEPANGHGLPHDPFNAIVGPRPIGWISSHDREGRLNLAPYSFFNAFNYIPPIIGFSSVGRKDSLNNIEQTGEFVWNLATRPLAEQMNQSCAAVSPEVNEFELSGLTPVAVLRQRERTAVRGIAVDPRGARAWVLGPRGLDQHDAASGRLLARYPAPEGVALEAFEPADGHSLRVRGGGRLFEPRPGCGCLARVAAVDREAPPR